MSNSRGILKIYPESFRANMYDIEPFRMIGLIDVDIMYNDTIEKVILPFFRSSGTNSGKVQGLWYPIAGIKIYDGKFKEFTPYINFVLKNTTKDGRANAGWLAKSLFFGRDYVNKVDIRGFSNGMYYKGLFWIGRTLRILYERDEFEKDYSLDAKRLNSIVTSKEIYENNKHSQRRNFEKFIEDIYKRY